MSSRFLNVIFEIGANNGGLCGDRTHDLMIKSHPLYQSELTVHSYRWKKCRSKMYIYQVNEHKLSLHHIRNKAPGNLHAHVSFLNSHGY